MEAKALAACCGGGDNHVTPRERGTDGARLMRVKASRAARFEGAGDLGMNRVWDVRIRAVRARHRLVSGEAWFDPRACSPSRKHGI